MEKIEKIDPMKVIEEIKAEAERGDGGAINRYERDLEL